MFILQLIKELIETWNPIPKFRIKKNSSQKIIIYDSIDYCYNEPHTYFLRWQKLTREHKRNYISTTTLST